MTEKGSIASRHPSAATLASYVAGNLGQAAGTTVAAHLLHCEHCITMAARAEDVDGLLIAELPPSPLNPDALQRTMDRIRDVPAPQPTAPFAKPAVAHYRGAALILDRLGLPAPKLRWVAPGIRMAVLLQERWRHNDSETLFVLRIRPGTALPDHGHVGTELTCVLEGAFADEGGYYGVGDVAEAEEDVRHRPVAEGPTDCVCLIATRGRLRFSGLIGRLAGAYLKI